MTSEPLVPKFNICFVADSPLGIKHSEETRMKMSLGRLGEKNHNFGKNLSEETRQKISKIKKNLTGENSPRFGIAHSEEAKKKISQVHTGKVVSEEITA